MMMTYPKKESGHLLKLARDAIASSLSKIPLQTGDIPANCLEKRACFVTLEQNERLRGCIGHLIPTQELYKDVIHCARAAAFGDPRFPPLQKDELDKTKIEISVLRLPQKLKVVGKEAILKYLKDNKPGVIVKRGNQQATFLPQVWEQLPDPADFLTHLCQKAGLAPDEWENNLEIETYDVDKIKEP